MSITVSGGCHCGLVHFEADLPSADVEVLDCNCSICAMTGYLHLIVSESAFRLTDGKSETTSYRLGSGKARHIFCATCGIKSFYERKSVVCGKRGSVCVAHGGGRLIQKI